MVTVRRENDSMGAIDVPTDKLWARKLTFTGTFSYLYGENAGLVDPCAG